MVPQVWQGLAGHPMLANVYGSRTLNRDPRASLPSSELSVGDIRIEWWRLRGAAPQLAADHFAFRRWRIGDHREWTTKETGH